MTLDRAAWIGRRRALKAVAVGVLLAYGLMAYFTNGWRGPALLWPAEFGYGWNLLIGTGVFGAAGCYFGGQAGRAVLVRQQPAGWAGAKCGVLTLLVTAALSGVPGFLQEGIALIGTPDNPFVDYLYKPALWIVVFGFLPAALVGIWLGYSIKAAGRKAQEAAGGG